MPKTQRPQTLTGLARILAKHGERAFVVANADTSLKPVSNKVLVDVGHIPGFNDVHSTRSKVTIGTGANFGEVLRQVKGENGLLQQALSMMANPLVRNRVTVFSALFADSHYFDLTTALVNLQAKVRLQSLKGGQTMTINEYLLAAAEGLKPGEFPASVEFPKLDPGLRVGFFRVNPGGGRPTVSASVKTRLRRNMALDPEIIVSSSTVIPVHAPSASRALKRQPLNDTNVKRVAAVAALELLEMADLEEDVYEQSLIEIAVSRAIRRVNEAPSPMQKGGETIS
jgi:CO/xanthine dehydrogenase FAD-binding subunit